MIRDLRSTYKPKQILADSDGAFRLGLHEEGDKASTRRRYYSLDFDGRSSVYVEVGQDGVRPVGLIAASVPIHSVVNALRDSMPRRDVSVSNIAAWCDALPRAGVDVGWKSLVVRYQLSSAGTDSVVMSALVSELR